MNQSAVLGYPVALDDKASLLANLQNKLIEGQHQHVVTLNPEMLMRGRQDAQLEKILKNADIVLPDGAGIVWALGQKGIRVNRLAGIEFAEALIANAASMGKSIALIGASPEVSELAEQGLKQKYPGLSISYRHHGFFASAQDRLAVAKACAQSGVSYVFVALGVPAQELWIEEFKPLFTAPTAFVGVGGSFDIWSGSKKRAPAMFRVLNLEWLYRITSEPWRIPRVYKPLPLFVLRVLMEKGPN